MIPGVWLNEGGQSAAGAAIDHLVALHPASAEAAEPAAADGKSLPDWLADRAAARRRTTRPRSCVSPAGSTSSPSSSATARPSPIRTPARSLPASGWTATSTRLMALYVAGLCGLGYGLRQIIETQASNGAPVEAIAISGGRRATR